MALELVNPMHSGVPAEPPRGMVAKANKETAAKDYDKDIRSD